jgi:Lar family restriction alleviation protein
VTVIPVPGGGHVTLRQQFEVVTLTFVMATQDDANGLNDALRRGLAEGSITLSFNATEIQEVGVGMNNLRPCPFCGSRAVFGEITEPDDPNFGGVFITCSGCVATTDLRFPLKEDVKPLLAEQWNRRVFYAWPAS